MRQHLIRFAFPLIAFGLAACTQKAAEDDQGAGGASAQQGAGGSGGSDAVGGSGNAGGSGATGGGPGAPGWTAVPLLDDMTDPDSTAYRAGNDLVTGIFFKSADDGWVTTTGDEQTFGKGGAVFKAKQKEISSILFSGNRDGLCLLGSIDFTGIEPSPDGFIATAYACDVIASHDGGGSFDISRSVAGEMFGIERVLGMRQHAGGTLGVYDTGYLASTPGAPGPNAIWSTVYAPTAVPTVPDPVPADQCQVGPSSPPPEVKSPVFVSADAKLVAYVANADNGPEICVSTDGGKSFFPHLLPGVGEGAMGLVPNGVTFINGTTGIAYWANYIYPGESYIYRTTDTGKTWTKVEVPSDIAGKGIEFRSAFFAPDAVHGWIVGYDYDAGVALLLKTDDAGATWKHSSGDLAAKVSEAGGGKLYSGFALDEHHIWVGGEYGILMANEAGGE